MSNPDLSPGARFRCVTPLTIRIEGPGRVRLLPRDDSAVSCGTDVLPILDLFSTPRTLEEAAGTLAEASVGAVGFTDAMSRVVSLVRERVLVSEGPQNPGPAGYADPSIHVAMLNDTARTEAFVDALRDAVEPDDIVVDLGTGSGVLATAASRAGARHVYAIEASTIADTAEHVFRKNDVAERITLVRGWSTDVELPEPGTILVSEMIGHEALGERLLEVTLDARRRFLAPGAQLIPRAIDIFGLAVALPDDERARFAPDPSTLERWTSTYGVDFAPLRDLALDARSTVRSVRASKARSWRQMTEPVPLVSIDLATFQTLGARADAEVTVREAGRVDAVVVFWELDLDGMRRITIDPEKAGDTHWRIPAWYLFEPVHVVPGDRLVISYRYRVAGERDGLMVHKLD